MTAENAGPRSPTLAIAIGAAALVVLAVVTFTAIAMGGSMGGMMNGCGGMAGCHGGRGANQTPSVLTGDEVTIRMKDFDFSPRDATIAKGATVTWVNEDAAPHDATDDNKAWATAKELMEAKDWTEARLTVWCRKTHQMGPKELDLLRVQGLVKHLQQQPDAQKTLV